MGEVRHPRLNPPHVMLARAIALPLIWLGRLGDWLWDVFA
jgi:hypothetical protein